MTYDLEQAVRERRSVRTYGGPALPAEERAALMDCAAAIPTVFGTPIRFRFLDHAGAESGYDLHCKGVVTGTETYIAAAAGTGEMRLEDFGYALEQLVLFAQSRGIGTCWIAGTMNREAFERAMELQSGETMAAILSVGHAADRPSLRERAMRKAIKADTRLGWAELFFDGDLTRPLTETAAGPWTRALEMVRLAPSAVNKQPWRIVRDGNAWHFLERRTLSGDPESDVQRVDMGIAMLHFETAAREAGLSGRWERREGPLPFPLPGKTVYTVTWAKE